MKQALNPEAVAGLLSLQPYNVLKNWLKELEIQSEGMLGQPGGNQGGVLTPKDIDLYFKTKPDLRVYFFCITHVHVYRGAEGLKSSRAGP